MDAAVRSWEVSGKRLVGVCVWTDILGSFVEGSVIEIKELYEVQYIASLSGWSTDGVSPSETNAVQSHTRVDVRVQRLRPGAVSSGAL